MRFESCMEIGGYDGNAESVLAKLPQLRRENPEFAGVSLDAEDVLRVADQATVVMVCAAGHSEGKEAHAALDAWCAKLRTLSMLLLTTLPAGSVVCPDMKRTSDEDPMGNVCGFSRQVLDEMAALYRVAPDTFKVRAGMCARNFITLKRVFEQNRNCASAALFPDHDTMYAMVVGAVMERAPEWDEERTMVQVNECLDSGHLLGVRIYSLGGKALWIPSGEFRMI